MREQIKNFAMTKVLFSYVLNKFIFRTCKKKKKTNADDDADMRGFTEKVSSWSF